MRMGTENKILISLAGVLCPTNPCWSNYCMTLYSTEYQRGLDDFKDTLLPLIFLKGFLLCVSFVILLLTETSCSTGAFPILSTKHVFEGLNTLSILKMLPDSKTLQPTTQEFGAALQLQLLISPAVIFRSFMLKTDTSPCTYVEPHCPSLEAVFIPWCS